MIRDRSVARSQLAVFRLRRKYVPFAVPSTHMGLSAAFMKAVGRLGTALHMPSIQSHHIDSVSYVYRTKDLKLSLSRRK